MAGVFIVVLACLAVTGSCIAEESTASPVEKVIGLLKKLKVESEDEGATEAMQYDKYACFCKAQAESKLASIAKNEGKINFSTAKIKNLGAIISELSEDVSTTKGQKTTLEDEMVDEQSIRDKEHNAYLIQKADLVEACRGSMDAIDMLKGRRGSMEGAKVTGLLQRAVAHDAVRFNRQLTQKITSLLEVSDSEDPHAFQFSSNEILETLADVLKQFKVNKNDLETKEQNDKHTFDMSQGGRANQHKAFTDTITKNEALIASKEEDKNKHEDWNEEAKANKDSDQTFLDELVVQCKRTAKAWDQRSKSRGNELMAINEALEILRGKVSANYGANAKLVDLQVGSNDVSLLQTDSLHSANHQVVKFLQRRAKELKSTTLATFLLKLKADHFVKVRGMIKDMVAKLENDAEEEQTQKGWCDEEMEKATSKRDEHIGKMEGDSGNIAETKATLEELAMDIKEQEQQIADLYKALNEATDLRKKESTENKKTVEDSKAGLAAVRAAKQVLEDFYGFLQVKTDAQKYKPAKGDKDGNTVADLAPKTGFDEDYEGNQAASSGIIGLMEVIESDFERTIQETEDAESEGESDYEAYKSSTEADLSTKKQTVKDWKKDVNTKKGDLIDYQDEFHDHAMIKSEAIAELAKLEAPCTNGGSSYEERVKRREQEIESLQNAAKILTSMSLLQKQRNL